MIPDLTVKEGDPVRPAWERMKAAMQALRLLPGDGIQLRESALGTVISCSLTGGGFAHAWKPMLTTHPTGGSGLFLRPGTVNGVIPKIAGVVMSGDTKTNTPAPILKLDAAQVDADLWISYAVLEVELEKDNADGTITKNTRVEIVHRAKVASSKITVGCQELALIRWRKDSSAGSFTPIEAAPIAEHSFQFFRTWPTAGQGGMKLFFRAI